MRIVLTGHPLTCCSPAGPLALCMHAGGLLPPNWNAIDSIFKKVSKGLIKKIGKNVFVSQTVNFRKA